MTLDGRLVRCHHRERLTSEKARCREERLGVRPVDAGDAHTEAERWRGVLEPHPEAVEMSAQVGHPQSVATREDQHAGVLLFGRSDLDW